MTDTTTTPFDIEEQRVRIARSVAETEKFVAEQHKLLAEAYKLDRDRTLAPLAIGVGAFAALAGAAGAGAALLKAFGN